MSEHTWSGRAPAKVNLRLQILARETTGFHQIETVFQALELADDIELSLREDGDFTLDTGGTEEDVLGPPNWNLAVQAARRFAEAVGKDGGTFPGVDIRLEKRVPVGAGLGGGSSDAAAVLRGLNELSEKRFTTGELIQLGAEVGADVPFFVSGADRALAWGRGNRILPLPSLEPRPVLLVVPAQPIETAWAYGVLAEHREAHGIERSRAALLGGEPEPAWGKVAARAGNDFEAAVFPLRPELSVIKEALARAGARPALLSGSGSAVFGVFEEEEAREVAARALREARPTLGIIATRTVGTAEAPGSAAEDG